MSDDLIERLRKLHSRAGRAAADEIAIEAAQRIVTDFDIKLPRAFDALTVARALLSRRSERDAVLEEAAKVCERLNGGRIGWAVGAELDEAAAAIRALKENT